MGSLGSLIASVGLVSIGFTCLVGLAFLTILGIVISSIVAGARRGKLRVVTNERNFDDFSR